MTGSHDAARPTVRLRQILPAPPARVFAAWTDAAAMREWFCPGEMSLAVAELDVRVGGNLRLVMRGDEGDREIRGVYREVVPASRLVFTWSSPGTYGEESLVTVELRALGQQTQLTLTHELLPDADAADRHQHGWESILGKLSNRFASMDG